MEAEIDVDVICHLGFCRNVDLQHRGYGLYLHELRDGSYSFAEYTMLMCAWYTGMIIRRFLLLECFQLRRASNPLYADKRYPNLRNVSKMNRYLPLHLYL